VAALSGLLEVFPESVQPFPKGSENLFAEVLAVFLKELLSIRVGFAEF
jgi:hypothetical protein